MATKLKIFTVWILFFKKLCWSLSQPPSNSVLSSLLMLYSSLATSGPLHCPPSAWNTLPPGSRVSGSSPERPLETALNNSIRLLILCPPCPAFPHGHLSPCSLSAYLVSVSSMIEHTTQEPRRCFCLPHCPQHQMLAE